MSCVIKYFLRVAAFTPLFSHNFLAFEPSAAVPHPSICDSAREANNIYTCLYLPAVDFPDFSLSWPTDIIMNIQNGGQVVTNPPQTFIVAGPAGASQPDPGCCATPGATPAVKRVSYFSTCM